METRSEKFAEAIKKYKKECTVYSFQIDTEDIVFGNKKTLKKSTKDLSKYLKMKMKLSKDVGRYIGASVILKEVRIYKNGELVKILN